ncbi:MAG: FliM/FliN family flagellar motor switch protein [Aquidulcibacter sp.]|uniref:FliM/FliN family flagellar motor switch protein n=1 Tax=Aquidulcibacter sp. TaxID=2052990 RepID=UPI0022C0FF11|nr:FliM/FliN family flagellar motor switch protein [Aquidulcibacter sp.]MCZ8281392.1 FliM/FliN family flagellar motor switch protein [Aquidulcibacter sp.]
MTDDSEHPPSQIEKVMVEISVLVGRSSLPMHQLLRMGRGAVIPLTASPNDAVWVLVNNHPVARGDIQLDDDKISVEITGEADVYDYLAGP